MMKNEFYDEIIKSFTEREMSNNGRTIKMVTSGRGAQMFHRQLQITLCKDMLCLQPEDKRKSIFEMLTSNDEESITLAIELTKNL